MRLQELCDFYEFVEEGIKCFFFLILGAAFLLIILLFSNFLAPKKIDVPSENAKVYELISVKQSKSFLGSIYYEILYMDVKGEVYENREFENNKITMQMVVGDENKYVTENHGRHEYIWLYITEETLDDVLVNSAY